MTILRFLNIQGIAGIAVGLALAILLVVQKAETSHWRKQSAAFEQEYAQSQAAFAQTVANARAAADAARAADSANVARVSAEQQSINQRSSNDYETRLADARTAAANLVSGRLRVGAQAAADPGAGRGAPMPGIPAAAGGAAQTSDQDRLPPPDQLTATEQAIQLDELIKWVRRQAAVDPNQPARSTGQARPR
jgi:ABC-type transport system involved in cytochrome bd biosynthesis fused ATPase/permease subunit